MFWRTVLLLLIIKSTAILAAQWKLAFNIHAADGHDFGYLQKAWEDDSDVGSDKRAFLADYKSYDVNLETANFIAIVRHQNGVCDAARVWEFLIPGKSLKYYLDRTKSQRIKATSDNYTYNYRSHHKSSEKKDPIFSVDGQLVFNWLYRDNGVRIGVSGNYRGVGRLTANADDDAFVGLGNSFHISTADGNNAYKQDVGVHKGYVIRGSQGTDHGSSLKDGMLLGQYAIFISNAAATFPCNDKHRQLQIEMTVLTSAPTLAPTTYTQGKFRLIDRNQDGYLNFAETFFDLADINNDGFLSFREFEATLKVAHVKGD